MCARLSVKIIPAMGCHLLATYQERDHPEKYFLQYITQLSKQGVLKDSDMSLLFFRVCAG